jgi:hypothetical protein
LAAAFSGDPGWSAEVLGEQLFIVIVGVAEKEFGGLFNGDEPTP